MSNATAQSSLSPRSPPSSLPQRPRPQYSLYDNIRCTGTGDGEPPQCDLPMEVVCNIFDYANFTCAMSASRVRVAPSSHREDVASSRCHRHRQQRRCEKKLCPWTIKEGWKHTYLCSRACFKETCVFQ